MNRGIARVYIRPEVGEFMHALNRALGRIAARQIDYMASLAPKPVMSVAELAQRLAHDPTPWGTIRLSKGFTE